MNKILLLCFLLCSLSIIAQSINKLNLQPDKLAYAQKIEKQAIKQHDTKLLAESYYLYGKTYSAAADYQQSSQWILKALRLLEPKGVSYELGRIYIFLAHNEAAQGHHNKASELSQKALRIFKEVGSAKGQLKAYRALMDCAIVMSSHPDASEAAMAQRNAQYYFKQLEHWTITQGDSVDFADLLNRKKIFTTPENILELTQKSLSIYKNKKIVGGEVDLQLELVGVLITSKRLSEAYTILTAIQQTEVVSHTSQRQLALHLNWANYYEQMGQWQQALVHAKAYHDLYRQVMQQDHEGAVSRLLIAYETEKKDAKLKAQTQEIALQKATEIAHNQEISQRKKISLAQRNELAQRQKILLAQRREIALAKQNETAQRRLLWALAALLVGTLTATVFFRRLSHKNKRISERNAELVREQNHRVKNNLQVLSSLLSLQSNRLSDPTAKTAIEESQLRVETMAILQRRLYDGDGLVTVQAQDFVLEIAEMVLHTFGLSDTVELKTNIAPLSLGADHALRVGLILNELLTNACKYAFADHKAPCLQIVFQKTQEKYHLEFGDNGPGLVLDTHQRPSKHSFGMRLIEMQVAQLEGTYQFNNTRGTNFSMFF